MFNSSELQGEVDHSFFDSDNSGDESKKVAKSLKAEQQNAKNLSGNSVADTSVKTQSKGKPSKRVEISKRSRASSVSGSCATDKAKGGNSDSEDDSCLQSPERSHTGLERKIYKKNQQQRSMSSSSRGTIQQEDSYRNFDEELMGKSTVKTTIHGGRIRKNYSFPNDEVRRIDRENQRLLRELSRLTPRLKPGSAMGKIVHVTSNSPVIHSAHNTINRHRQQQRIDRENLAFLKRLEATKATPGLRRSEQLADHQRQVRYPGGSMYLVPITESFTTKKRCSPKTYSAAADPRSVSSSAAFTDTDSNSTPVPRS